LRQGMSARLPGRAKNSEVRMRASGDVRHVLAVTQHWQQHLPR